MLPAEQELRSLAAEVAFQRDPLGVQLGAELGVVRVAQQLGGRFEVVGAAQELRPEVDLGTDAVRLGQGLGRGPLVVPESGLARQRLELAEAGRSGRKVKDAPTSTGSAPPGRGRPRRPSVPDLEILEQDRTELDESEGRLAPGDDGVHAGAVAVVGADAAIAVAVESGGVAAGPAIAFAGDQIDEGRFLSLLHKSLTSSALAGSTVGTGPSAGRGDRDAGHAIGGRFSEV
jgi:hypothetical protein